MTDTGGPTTTAIDAGWLGLIRRYLLFIVLINLVWEVAQLPLYTLWTTGTPGQIAFAVLHCTAGDVLIAVASLVVALIVAGRGGWPAQDYRRVAVLAVALGIGFTAYSEWYNTTISKNWAYAGGMPTITPLNLGFSLGVAPLVQWLVVPLMGFVWARDRSRAGLVASGSWIPAVLDFWFLPPDHPDHGNRRDIWFEKDATFDAKIRAQLFPLVVAAAHGDLDPAVATPKGTLALLLLLDQFPRNLFRGEPRAFATDAKALSMARRAVDHGFDQAVMPIASLFFYMPFVHSEDRDDQTRAVALIESLPAGE
ncbi:MAG: DUF924 domain-containing protein, partial [Rhodospirillales bacterium]|nr:DUF924 domain-containing protein [Rhodospirillales bacterium]